MTTLFDGFISYGRADSKAFATQLQARLADQGLRIWFDQNDIPLGVDFQNQIDDGIEKSHNFIFIIAPHSVNSEYCLKEIQLAVQLNKRIIPLLHIEEIDYNTWLQRTPNGTPEQWAQFQADGRHAIWKRMHPVIGRLNWIYFNDEQRFKESFQGLANLIRHHADYVEQHTRFLVQALAWERNQRQTHYLLIGEERLQAEAWLIRRFSGEQPPCEPTDLHCEFICESTKNAHNLMTQVFISYATENKDLMLQIRFSLMREGITIWTNKTDLKTGVEFQTEINRGIEGADNLIYLISSESIRSSYCQQEVAHAFTHHKRVIGLLIEPIDLEQIPPAVSALQFIDLTEHHHPEQYQVGIDKLLNELKQEARYYEQHKILLVKALKWQHQQHNPSILLRGHNLQQAKTWLSLAQQQHPHPPLPLHHEFIVASAAQPADLNQEVFISYSRVDADFARKLNDALQMQGKTTWFDQESIASGTDFQQEIYQGISHSNNFLFIISPSSVNSPYCADEVEYAQTLSKRFITLLYRPTSVKEIHPILAGVQWIDFNQHHGDFYSNFSELIRTLDTDREHVHNHTKWLQRALEWTRKERGTDLLLRGSEFTVAKDWLTQAQQSHKQPLPTPLQEEFIAASQQAIEETRAAEAERQAQLLKLEQERNQEAIARRFAQDRQKTQRIFTVIMGIALLISIGLGTFAYHQMDIAQSARTEAEQEHAKTTRLLEEVKKQTILLKEEKARVERLTAEKELQIHLDQAEDAIDKGDHITAIFTVLKNLPSKPKENAHLVTVSTVLDNSQPDQLDNPQKEPNNEQDNIDMQWKVETILYKTLQKLPESVLLEGHQGRITEVAFSPDDNQVITMSSDNTVRLWEVRSGELLCVLEHPVALSPDGRWVLTTSVDNDNTVVILWEMKDSCKSLGELIGYKGDFQSVFTFSPKGKLIFIPTSSGMYFWELDASGNWNLESSKHLLPNQGEEMGEISHATLSYDNSKLVTISGSNYVLHAWDLDSGEQLAQVESAKLANAELSLFMNHVNHIEFNPINSHQVIIALDTGIVPLWNIDRNDITRMNNNHSGDVLHAAFSPNGKFAITTSNDSTAILWDVKERRLLHILVEEYKSSITKTIFTPDSKQVITISSDGTERLWDINTGENISAMKVNEDGVTQVAFSSIGEWFITAFRDGTARRWKMPRDNNLELRGHTNPIWNAAFSPDGTKIITVSKEIARLWNAQSGQQLHSFKKHTNWISRSVFSWDSQWVLTTSDYDRTTRVWDVKTGKQLYILNDNKNKYVGPNNEIKISPSTRFDTTFIWDTKSNKLLHQLEGDFADISFDGKQMLTISKNKFIFWQTENQEPLWTVESSLLLNYPLGKYKQENETINFSKSSQLITVSNENNTFLKIWKLENDKQLIYEEKLALLSPNEDLVLTVSKDNSMYLWQLENGELLYPLEGSKEENESIHFSQGGKLIFAFSEDNVQRTWQVESGKLLKEGQVVNLSPDEEFILTIENNIMYLWKTENGELLHQWEGYKEKIKDIKFSPNGKLLLLISRDNALHIWDIEKQKLIYRLPKFGDNFYDYNYDWEKYFLSPDNKLMFLVSEDKTLYIWDMESRTPVYQLIEYESHNFISENRKLVFLITEDKILHVFDMESHKQIYQQLEEYGRHTQLIPDSHIMLLASEYEILIWDTENGTTLYQTKKQPDQKIDMVKFSPDNQHIAIAFSDQSVLFWDLNSSKTRRIQHTDDIVFMVFSTDGKQVLTTTTNEIAILWRSDDFWQPTEEIIEHTQETIWKTLAPQQREELLLHLLGINQETWDEFENLEPLDTQEELEASDISRQQISYVWEDVWHKLTPELQEHFSLQVLRLLWQTTRWEEVSFNQFQQLSAGLIEPLSIQGNIEENEQLPEYYNISLLHRLEKQWKPLTLAQKNQVLKQVVALTLL